MEPQVRFDMQIYTYVLRVASAWKRSVTGWFSQQYQLYLWSVYAGLRDIYWRLLRYPGTLVLSTLGYTCIVFLCGYIPGMTMVVTAVSVLGTRITLLNPAWHLRIPDIYLAMRSWISIIYASSDNKLHHELRGYASDVFVLIMLLQVVVWSLWQYGVTPYWSTDMGNWAAFVYPQPVLIMISFFLLDSQTGWKRVPRSVYRAMQLIWYNLPLCIIVSICGYAWRYGITLIPYGWCIEIAVIPVWISAWYTIYMKSIYEQFARYYGDIFTCQADTT